MRKVNTNEVVYDFSSPSATMGLIRVGTSIPEEFSIQVIITEKSGVVFGNFTNCVL
ncbi:hypothetical protein [Chishuiella sp.]|uniref:hypothetical protein n=1 Tax=Chishuiella sp. TaxID=1969467 RepID=UPI0028B1CDB9|nr:hypothetical protein [Chishuiella sp.]